VFTQSVPIGTPVPTNLPATTTQLKRKPNMAHKLELAQEELKAYVDLGAKLNGEFFNAG
jgi:hypothetical protein